MTYIILYMIQLNNYKINNLKKDSLKYLIDSWSPYKTVASLLLWKSIEEKVFYEG